MICKNCGEQISENSRFCPQCGAYILGEERAVPQNFWSKRNIIILAASAAVLVIGIIITVIISTSDSKINSMLLTAESFLSDHEYDKAIDGYRKVIEKEPENADAYLGIAEAYMAQGKRDAAISVLQTGIEKTGDQRLKNRQNKITGANNSDQSSETSENNSSAATSSAQSISSTPASSRSAVSSKNIVASSKNAAVSKNVAASSKPAASKNANTSKKN